MKTLTVNGHSLDVPGSTLLGKEEIRYDGSIVSSKRSVLGAKHEFVVHEDGQQVQYVVQIGTRWNGSACCSIEREGVVLFSDR